MVLPAVFGLFFKKEAENSIPFYNQPYTTLLLFRYI